MTPPPFSPLRTQLQHVTASALQPVAEDGLLGIASEVASKRRLARLLCVEQPQGACLSGGTLHG